MIHLILGGARSGKSRYAEELASASGAAVCVVATATANDDEMRERIERHQAQRPPHWCVVEEPFALADAIRAQPENCVVLVDCLTLWLSNWLCSARATEWPAAKKQLLETLQQSRAHLVLVSNEVGSGIIPLGQLSREFADHAGWLNQAIAALADQVTLVVAGLPVSLKINPQEDPHAD